MVFRCNKCNKIFLFKNGTLLENHKFCNSCIIIKENEKKELEKQLKKQEHIDKKQKQKEENRKIADIKLKEELEKEKNQKSKVSKKPVLKKIKKEIKKTIIPKRKPIIISLEKEAEQESKIYDSVLYVFIDVKHVRAIEWKGGKRRIALNKEREVRRTHAGGFSQEKFQSFIDSKKKKTAEWAIDQLGRGGVLRSPYELIIVDSADKDIKEKVEIFLKVH